MVRYENAFPFWVNVGRLRRSFALPLKPRQTGEGEAPSEPPLISTAVSRLNRRETMADTPGCLQPIRRRAHIKADARGRALIDSIVAAFEFGDGGLIGVENFRNGLLGLTKCSADLSERQLLVDQFVRSGVDSPLPFHG